MSKLIVMLDDDVRLATAVLAATLWPEIEQAQEPHAVHQQSKLTRQFMSDFKEAAVVATANRALEQGVPLNQIVTEMLLDKDGSLATFGNECQIKDMLWSKHQRVWHEATQDLEQIFAGTDLPQYLHQLTGHRVEHQIVVVPTLVYPMLACVVAQTADCYFVILPPPKAWGESPPWPYRDGSSWVLAETCRSMTMQLLREDLPLVSKEQVHLLKHGAAALFLEKALDDEEFMAYLVRAKRQFKLPELPVFVDSLRRCFDEPEAGSGFDLLAFIEASANPQLLR